MMRDTGFRHNRQMRGPLAHEAATDGPGEATGSPDRPAW
jgi:hypothetical protein